MLCHDGAIQGLDVGHPGRRSREAIRPVATRFPRELCPGLSKRCPFRAKCTSHLSFVICYLSLVSKRCPVTAEGGGRREGWIPVTVER